jgi:pilus assembly protein CpaE
MAQNWFAYAGEGESDWLESVVRALDPGATVESAASAFDLRDRLRESDGSASAAICDCTDVEPINLAAALVKDGCAREVLLVVEETSGSLRSRAAAAGVARVLSREEAEIRLRAVGPAAAHACPEEARDLDEPSQAVESVQRRYAAPVIALASGRGGVGKSAIAAAMALSAASWGMKVALVDLDLSFGNQFGFFGLDGPVDMAALVKDPAHAAQHGRDVAENLVLYGPCARPEYAETVPPVFEDLLESICRESDLVVVDTASCWGECAAQAVQAADRVLLTCDERAGALSSLARSGALCVRLGVARTRIVRLMNRCDSRRRDETFLARAELGLETARSVRILDGGSDVAELFSSGHAADLVAEDSPFSLSCSSAVAKILAELGKLPKTEAARKAREMKEPKPRGLSLFKGAV